VSGEVLALTVTTPGQRHILSIPVDDVTIAEVVEQACDWVRGEAGTVHQIVTVNPEFIIAARANPGFRAVLEQADLSTADGIGVLLAARLLGQPLRSRVTGVDLVEAMAARAEPNMRLFLLGAGPGVAERAAASLVARFPGCGIAGTWSGSPRREDAGEALKRINAVGATVVLVAYGAPEQDLWIDRYRSELAACGIVLAVGVGGTLDYLAGEVPRAPEAVRRLGFEWLYRLIRQPWRWRRQLALPLFAALVLRERLFESR
jgi:N-acetylglucosaminyldiphosphoundecaprenol N-acetyl-beta-D-mannosaminyltransferase